MAANNNQLLYFARMMIQKNSNKIPNTPWAQAAVNAIMNGDAQVGEQLANNLCQSNGVSKEQALQQAGRFFTS